MEAIWLGAGGSCTLAVWPIIQELSEKGHEVTVTAWDAAYLEWILEMWESDPFKYPVAVFVGWTFVSLALAGVGGYRHRL